MEGTPSAECGIIQPNDALIEINGEDVTEWEHDDIVTMLKNNTTVNLVVADNFPGDGHAHPVVAVPGAMAPSVAAGSTENAVDTFVMVTVVRRPEGLGLSITEGERDGEHIATAVVAGGAAADAGVLEGDGLISVNGVSCSDKSHDQVIRLFAGAEELTLVLERGDEENVEMASAAKPAEPAEPADEFGALSQTLTTLTAQSEEALDAEYLSASAAPPSHPPSLLSPYPPLPCARRNLPCPAFFPV